MYSYFYVELNSCVKGELIQFFFDTVDKMNLGLLSEAEFAKYENDMISVTRYTNSSAVFGTIASDGKWYAVFDLGGRDVTGIVTSVRRFSPSFTMEEARKLSAPNGTVYVLNATDTATDGSMIQYWKDHRSKSSQINLDNKTFRCPSCGKTVETDDVHGAHVWKTDNCPGSLYITPMCASCNTSKVSRIFKVQEADLVKAPKK